MDDALIRLVLVTTTAVPAFALGFWAGLRARRVRRASPLATEHAPAAAATPLFRDRPAPQGSVHRLEAAAEGSSHPTKRVE